MRRGRGDAGDRPGGRLLAAMAAAGSKREFTARLADYGVAAGPESAAVTAVARALG